MQCPTCGRGVRKGQELCAYCGAFLGNAYLAEEGGGVASVGKAEMTPMQRTAPPIEFPEPELEEIEETVPEAGPPGTPAPTPAPTRPQLSGLLRFLFPLLFILIPLLNFLLRDSPLRRLSDERPVLQQAIFCENVSQGRPINPKTVFSVRQDPRVALYVRWTGAGGRHSYAVRWRTPGGTLLPTSASATRSQFGQGSDAFSTIALLPLRAGMPLGRWRVEVELDGMVQARPSFELRE